MKKIVTIAASLTAVVTMLCTSTACCLFSGTSEEKAAAKQELKSALAKAGSIAYSTAGRAKLESFLSEQVASGKLSEAQKAEALAAADQGVEKLTAYLESASKSTTATDTSTTSGTVTTSTTVPTTATDTSGTK